MELLDKLVGLVLVVLNLDNLVVHPHNHHKTLEFQVFNSLVMLVGRVVNITVVRLDLEVEAVPDGDMGMGSGGDGGGGGAAAAGGGDG